MSDLKWSDNQLEAIGYTKSNVLLSAGAGSGKTAVLTERIYQLVKNGADLSRFLILTFTNAASAEMRMRLRKRIMEDPSLGDLSSKIETSHIETFDAFALFLVKKYSFVLGVSSNIGILDNTLLSIKRNSIRNDVITHLYDTGDIGFLNLISKYCTKNDSKIRDYISELCKKAEARIDKWEYLNNFIDHYFDEGRLNELINKKHKAMIDAIDDAIKLTSYLEDAADADKILNALSGLDAIKDNFNALVTFANIFSFPRRGPKSISDPALRDHIKDSLLKTLIKEEDYGTKEEIINQYMETKPYVKTLNNMVIEIEKRLDEFKKEKNLYSFSDIAALALKALDIPFIQKEMSEYFDYILVDEYQDTSLIQEMVINKLERNNVCMVGDIKQSIYRFRFADCTLFQNKYLKYQKNDGGKLISLNASYRSREEVVNFVNDMFKQLMTPSNNPIDYSNGHTFEYGLKEYNEYIDSIEDFDPKVYKYLPIKGKPKYESEAEIIALDIINKVNNEYKVYDKDSKDKTKKFRKCSFKDFAIIMDRGTKFNDIKEILSKYGIPVKVVYNEPVKDSQVISIIKNLLKLLNGLIQEEFDDKYIHAFVAVARSCICEYKDDVIYDYVTKKTFNDSPIIEKLNGLKDRISQLPLYVITETLVQEFNLYGNSIKLKRFANNTNKIEIILNLIKGMDELGFSLDDLISYFEDLNNYDLEIDYAEKDVSEDSVTLITIHRSKGLEYPIVYLPGLTSIFKGGSQTSFLMDNDIGPVLPITGNTSKSSFFNHMYKINETKEQYEEKLRLFYVAITRARERLIMLYNENENGDSPIYSPIGQSSYRSLIHYLNLEDKYGVDFNMTHQVLKDKKTDIKDKTITIGKVAVPATEIVYHKASKDRDDSISDDLLAFGNEIHYLLEIADYENKDSSHISSPKVRKYVGNVLNSEIFKNVKNSQVLHEYSFFDEKNDVHGIIDCLVIKDDEVDIVDFKLKKIDDEKYNLQLHTYRDYISQITDKPIKMYLIGAITGEVKEIE